MAQNPVVVKYLMQLKGKTVSDIVFDNDEAYGLQFTDGTTAWIMTDAEGNGAGFLDIEKG